MNRSQRGGDFEALVRPHLDVLYRLAYRFTGQAADAEDLVQELLMRLYRGNQDFSVVKDLQPWLVRSLHNLFVDNWRHSQRTPFGHLHPEPWEELFQDSGGSETPEGEAQQAERRRYLLGALYQLSDEHRAVLVLHHMEGRDLPELAQLLDLPIGTLKSRLFRARRNLRAVLGKWNPFDADDVIADKTEVSRYGL